MAIQDASRVRLQFPLIDDTGDGTPNSGTDTYVCITGNFSWTGFTRGSTRIDCSETTLDSFGNLAAQFQGDKEIDYGSVSMDVDWKPDALTTTNSRILAAFKSGLNGSYVMKFPANVGETTGPIITIPAHMVKLTPMTNVMSTGNEVRTKANITLKINGEITITPAS